jgi:RNA recognition motif-containing protein
MNLSYDVTHDDLQGLFGKFGETDSIEIPFRKGGNGATLGIAYINFKDTEAAITSYASLDKSYYQGRKLHIMPSQKKPAAEPRPERTREEIEEWKKRKDE